MKLKPRGIFHKKCLRHDRMKIVVAIRRRCRSSNKSLKPILTTKVDYDKSYFSNFTFLHIYKSMKMQGTTKMGLFANL